MHWARTAPWPLPGDGLSHPGSVTLHPFFSLPHCIQPTFVLLLSAGAQYGRPDTGPLPGDGLSHPEHRAWQRIKPSASFGCPDYRTLRIFYRMHWKISLFSAMIEIIPWRDGENAEMGKPLSLPFFHPQKAGTCAWLFAPITGPVCAAGVHPGPWENWKKRPCCFFQT